MSMLLVVAARGARDLGRCQPLGRRWPTLLILMVALGSAARLRRRARAQLSTASPLRTVTPAGHQRRVGVMGGTFDPIHHGHLVAASEVQAWFDLDEVVFVPTGTPGRSPSGRSRRPSTAT